jgi:hypothetical protein
MWDARQKGRHPHGETQGSAKLTAAAVRQIRAQPDAASDLAERYGVSISTIRAALHGRTWSHVS